MRKIRRPESAFSKSEIAGFRQPEMVLSPYEKSRCSPGRECPIVLETILPLFSSGSPFLLAFPYWPEQVAFLVWLVLDVASALQPEAE
jgi:hypothetical protein